MTSTSAMADEAPAVMVYKAPSAMADDAPSGIAHKSTVDAKKGPTFGNFMDNFPSWMRGGDLMAFSSESEEPPPSIMQEEKGRKEKIVLMT